MYPLYLITFQVTTYDFMLSEVAKIAYISGGSQT